MSKINTFLVAIGMVFLAFSANAQLTFTFVPSNSTPALGETITVDVVVTGFTDIALYQYSINWNQSLLSYQGLSNLNLPGLSVGGSFGTTQTSNGILTTSWSDPGGGVTSVPDGTVIYTITYDVVASSGATTDIIFSGTPVGFEVYEGLGLNDITSSVVFNDATIVIDGGGGGGGGIPCSFMGFGMTVTSDSAATGDPVCLDVAVCNFSEIVSLQYTTQFDPAKLQFDNVTNFGGLENLSAGNFGTNNAGSGFITLSWFDTLGAGITVADETVIYSICFTAIGAGGEMDSVLINGALSPIEVTDANSMGSNIGLESIDGEVTITGTSGSAVTIIASQEQGNPGDTVTVDISVRNFDSIASMQASMLWDPAIISFFETLNPGTLPGSITFNTSPGLTNAGKLTFSWDDPGATGINLADDEIIFSIRYIIIGDVTDVSVVDFTNDPTLIEVSQAVNGSLEIVPLAKIPGLVEVIGAGVLTINIGTVAGCTGETVCIAVTPENFNEIVSMQYDVTWDTSQLTYINVQDFNLSGLTASQFNIVAGTRLRVSWFEASLDPQTLVDGDTIYSMCFEIKAPDGASESVSFDLAQTIEFSEGAGASPVTSYVLNDGGVDVTCASGPPMEVSDTLITNVLCNGDATGAIDITIINDAGPVTYLWSPGGATTQDISGRPQGTYSVTISDGVTILTETYIIAEPASALTVAMSATDVSINGGSDGTATATPSGGTTTYSYAWDGPGGSTSTITGLTAGTYNVTVTDANGCTVTDQVIVDEPAAVTANITASTNVSCFGGNDGEATVTPGGGVSPYTYAWNPNVGTTATVTGLSEGTYDVTVTDDNGATATTSVIITEPTELTLTIDNDNLSCNGADDGTATAVPGGGTSPYTYLWDNLETTVTITNLASGSYIVTLTDDNGCTATTSVIITEPTVLTLTVDDDNLSCNGADDGTATAVPGGGTSPYTYLWDNLETTITITNLIPGPYTVTVTDDNGCTEEGTTFVSEPTVLTVSGSVSHESGIGANDGSISVTPSGGTPGFNYAWDPNVGTTANVSGLAPGDYTVTVTDGNGCTVAQTFTVNEFDAPMITVDNVTDIDCNGDATGAINISVSGGVTPYIYAWDPDGENSEDISGKIAGNYTVTVTDDIGTTAVETITIDEPSPIVIIIDGHNDVACNGDNTGSINITVTGGTPGYTFDWGGTTDEDPTGLPAGVYFPAVTDANGCVQIGANVMITEPAPLSLSVVSTTNINCNGDATGEIDISVTGGTTPYTYDWGFSSSQDLTGLFAGTYTPTITDDNGCVLVGAPITLSEPAALTASSSTTSVSCNGADDGTITLTVSGGVLAYSYNWNQAVPFPNQGNQTGVAAGTYFVTVTDDVGCTTVRGPIAVTQPAVLTVSSAVTNASASNDDGAINLTVTGGTPNYSFNWSNGATTEDLNSLPSGCYVVTVEDVNGCTEVDSIKVGGIIVISGIVTNVSCAGSCDGGIDITTLGGIPPYTYNWSGVGVVPIAPDQTNLCAGDYSVTIEDSNGSLTTANFTIGSPTALTISSSIITNETGNGCNGAVNITVTGGTQPYSYQWNNGMTSQDITNVCKGDYNVTIIDANGCILISNTFTVGPPPLEVAMTDITMATCDGSSDGKVCIDVLGGCGPYTLTLNSNSIISVSGDNICFDDLVAGNYTIDIKDSGNPQLDIDYNFIITDPEPVTITVLSSNDNTDASGNNCNGSIDIDVSGGVGNYSYLWSNGEISEDIDNVCESPPSYCVTVTDGNGCTATQCEVLDLGLSVQVVSTNNISCFGECDGAIDIQVTGGVLPYIYTWSPSGGSNSDPNGLCAGTYTVTVTDGSGATISTTATIDQPSTPLTVIVENMIRPTSNDANGLISLTVNGGWGFASVSWSGPNGFTGNSLTIGGLVEGFYTATVIDANGCIEVITVELPANRLFLDFEFLPPNCNGDADGQIEVFVSGGSGTYSIIWSNGQSGDLAFDLVAGEYSVTVTDTGITGLSASETVELTEPEALNVALEISNATGPADGMIEATVTGGTAPYTYIWSTGESTPKISRLSAGTYGLQVTDAHDCEFLIGQIPVIVEGECLEARRVISPNGDGKNDELIISCVENFNNNLKVFNRWGQLVYEADNYDNTWLGTGFDGQTLPESGYFWVLEYEENGQKNQQKGAFTLLRGE